MIIFIYHFIYLFVIKSACSNLFGSVGTICTSTSSHCKLSLSQSLRDHWELKPNSIDFIRSSVCDERKERLLYICYSNCRKEKDWNVKQNLVNPN